MKNLANCSPIEFLKQTNKIKEAVKDWLEKTKIIDIRSRVPDLPASLTKDEKKKALKKQVMRNFMDILDSALGEHPEETISILALVCFVEPEDANNHSMGEYLGCIADVLSDENVASFFVSLASLGQKNTSEPAEE